jgi:hypothetical protein
MHQPRVGRKGNRFCRVVSTITLADGRLGRSRPSRGRKALLQHDDLFSPVAGASGSSRTARRGASAGRTPRRRTVIIGISILRSHKASSERSCMGFECKSLDFDPPVNVRFLHSSHGRRYRRGGLVPVKDAQHPLRRRERTSQNRSARQTRRHEMNDKLGFHPAMSVESNPDSCTLRSRSPR